MVEFNKTRLNYFEKYQKMIEEYNSGSRNVDWFFTELLGFAKELNEEEKRAIAEKLTEEELAIFDLLTKPNINLSKQEITEDEAIAIKIIEGYDISFWDYFQKGKNSNIRRRWYERYKYFDSGWMRFLTDEEIKEIIEDNEYERGELEATGMGIMNMMDSIHGNDAW